MFYDRASKYAPMLTARWGSLARAYQYRYLARRAVWSRGPETARDLLHKALGSDAAILRREPVRTVATILGVYMLSVLPARMFGVLERTVMVAKNMSTAS